MNRGIFFSFGTKLSSYAPYLLLGIFFAAHFVGWWSHTHSIYFEDETEHVTIGWMVAEHGKKLYVDISTNHQPLPILLSALLVKLMPFHTLYQLITGMRLLMFGLSLLGAVLLTWRFRWRGLLAVLFIEAVKYYFFGFYILQESIALYPFMILIGLVLEKLLEDTSQSRDFIWFGLALYVSFFSLLPLTPYLFLLCLAYALTDWKQAFKALVVFVGLTGGLFGFFVQPSAWYKETIVHNLLYMIPDAASQTNVTSLLWRAFFPLTSWQHYSSVMGYYLSGLSGLIALGFLFVAKKSLCLKKVVWFLILFFGLSYADIRTGEMTSIYYTAFHALPMLGGYALMTAHWLYFVWPKIPNLYAQKLILIGVIMLLGSLYANYSVFSLSKSDKVTDYHVAYGDYQRIAEVLSLLKNDSSRLMAGPLHGYMNVIAKIPLYGKQNAYLNWSYANPTMRLGFGENVTTDPPEFIYFPESLTNDFYTYLVNTSALEKYAKIVTIDDRFTHLYVLRSHLSTLPDNPLLELNSLGYKIASDTTHTQTLASGYTVIINQVRGSECCSPGTTDNLDYQLKALEQFGLSASFVVRYDAINDPQFVSLLKQYPRHEIGLMLEIIPSLARDSGVTYKATPENWQEAQHAFLIGYSLSDRQKMIDKAFASFYLTFGYYPTTISAWMVDAWSLDYVRERYGVTVWQITREQFFTDSYSLYGGPPHYPYYPSAHWPIIPSNSGHSDVLMIRQTVSDPVRNYGDQTSSHTSQPNDYLQNKNFDYFIHLFNQAHHQPTNPYTFACLGLENSMPLHYQAEFSKQLSYLSGWTNTNRKVLTAREFRSQTNTQQALTVYEGDDPYSDAYAWWITTNSYRARVLFSRGVLSITDLRIYDDRMLDPYLSTPAYRMGWWIVPYILDGSRHFEEKTARNTLMPDVPTPTLSSPLTKSRAIISKTAHDVSAKRVGDSVIFHQNGVEIAWFHPQNFSLLPSAAFELFEPSFSSQASIGWTRQSLWGFWSDTREGKLTLTPYFTNQEALARSRETYYEWLFPQLSPRELSADNSFIYVNNRRAMAGRNPVRMIAYPRDQKNFPTELTQEITVTTNPTVDTVLVQNSDGSSGAIYIDLTHSSPERVAVTLTIGNISKHESISFYPDCRQRFVECITHPMSMIDYALGLLQQ